MKRMIMISVVLLTLIPTIIIGFAVNHYIQSMIRTEKLDMLAGTVHMMNDHIEKYYGRLILDIKGKTEMEEVLTLLKAGSAEKMSPSERARAEQVLKEYIGAPLIGGALADWTGKIVLSTESWEEGQMINRTEPFQKVINGGEDSFIGLVKDKNDLDIVEITVPVLDKSGERIGIVKQDIKLDLLSSYLESINLGENGYAFLIHDNGYMIDRAGESKLALFHEYQDSSSFEQLVTHFEQGTLKKNNGIVEFERNGLEFTGAYEKMDSLGFISVAVLEKNDIFGNLVRIKVIYAMIILFILIVVALCGYIIGQLHIKPLKMMNGTLKKITGGDLTERCRYNGNNEFGELCQNINHLADNYQRHERQLRLSARIDNLTHLPNQNAIYEVLDTLLYKHPNQALLLLELEGFKEINDNLGYDTGDRILMEVGDILRSLPQHVCYPSRLGGAEFLIFVTNWTAPKYPEKMAEKIIKRIEGIRFIDEIHVDVSASIGIEYADNERTDKRKLIKYANIAMHKAKNIGRNNYYVHYPYMQKD